MPHVPAGFLLLRTRARDLARGRVLDLMPHAPAGFLLLRTRARDLARGRVLDLMPYAPVAFLLLRTRARGLARGRGIAMAAATIQIACAPARKRRHCLLNDRSCAVDCDFVTCEISQVLSQLRTAQRRELQAMCSRDARESAARCELALRALRPG